MTPVQIKCINVDVPLATIFEIESCYLQAFDRFNHFIREALITLRDTNGPKGGVDKLCTIRLRFYPRGIAVVKSSASSFPKAVITACERMQQVTTRRLGRKKSGQFRSSPTEFDGGHTYGN